MLDIMHKLADNCIMMNANVKLKTLRLERGLNQADVAKRVKVNQATLSRFENGMKNVVLQIKLARYFGRPDLEPQL